MSGTVLRDQHGLVRIGWVLTFACLVIVALCASLVPVVRWFDRTSCDRAAAAMHRDGRSDWFAGCLVQTSDGSYVQLNRYRLNDQERGR